MIQIVAKTVLFLVELLGFGCVSMITGLWWTAGFTQGNNLTLAASFAKATVSLIVASVIYYKLVFKPRGYRSRSRFYFYTGLNVSALILYLYGVFINYF